MIRQIHVYTTNLDSMLTSARLSTIKEDLLDALVERMTHEGIARAKAIFSDGNIPLLEKLLVGVVPLIAQLIEEGNESGLFDAKWH